MLHYLLIAAVGGISACGGLESGERARMGTQPMMVMVEMAMTEMAMAEMAMAEMAMAIVETFH